MVETEVLKTSESQTYKESMAEYHLAAQTLEECGALISTFKETSTEPPVLGVQHPMTKCVVSTGSGSLLGDSTGGTPVFAVRGKVAEKARRTVIN